MLKSRAKVKVGALLGVVTLAAAACGSSTTSNSGSSTGSTTSSSSGSTANLIKPVSALKGANIVVGSKQFNEQLLLGQIAIQVLKAAGANPVNKLNLAGSTVARNALTSGRIDMYWEYTGTAWFTYLKHTSPVPGSAAQFQAVKKQDLNQNQIVWFDMAPMNDSYGIAVGPAFESKTHVKTLSQMAQMSHSNPSQVTLCVETEFNTRTDGLSGMEKTYNMSIPPSNIHVVNQGILYHLGATGSPCNYTEVYTTDGLIEQLHLTVLQDDKNFFPKYNAALTMKQQEFNKYPQLQPLFAPVAAKLTTPVVTHLNAEVSSGKTPQEVAHSWLVQEGFIKG
ncbi:MAG TPA: glycine betaine ABC transporter substrate-binding protein [Acidimicrobiales bacterium]|nr:glycine betaine ABC transporter substrate-binding protein [Acidimicrobiales bacterium]